MPIVDNFAFSRYEDGIINIELQPPTSVGGWNIQFQVSKRMGGTPLFTKSVSSGLNNASGVNVTDSGQGRFQVALKSADTSGLEYGNYAYVCERLDSGQRTILAEGFLAVNP